MSLPPEALAELKRLRRRTRLWEALAEVMLARLIYAELYPDSVREADPINLDGYLDGR